jgi:hypothetical protein
VNTSDLNIDIAIPHLLAGKRIRMARVVRGIMNDFHMREPDKPYDEDANQGSKKGWYEAARDAGIG